MENKTQVLSNIILRPQTYILLNEVHSFNAVAKQFKNACKANKFKQQASLYLVYNSEDLQFKVQC